MLKLKFQLFASVFLMGFILFCCSDDNSSDDDDDNSSQTGFWMLYGGADEDRGYSVQQTSDGGYIVCGGTHLDAHNWQEDVYLLKVDSQGNELWARSFGGDLQDYGTGVVQTSDGGYVVSGTFYSTNMATIIKVDQNGNELWTRSYLPDGKSYANAIQQTSDGGFIITGRYFEEVPDIKFFLLKTDSDGNEQWSVLHETQSHNEAYSVVQFSDGGYVYCGTSFDIGTPGQDLVVTRTDETGAIIWTFHQSSYWKNVPYRVQTTSDNGIVVFGEIQETDGSVPNMYLLKLNSSGHLEWEQRYTDSHGECYSGTQASDGGFVLCGLTWTYTEGINDVYLVKTDSSGNKQWGNALGSYGINNGHCIEETSDGGFIITGTSSQHVDGDLQLLLIKTDSEGNFI